MSGKKLGKEAFHRMNYLYQAAKLCHQMDSVDSLKLSLHYGSHIKSVGHKAQCKMDPQLKRTLCKGCNAILIPGETVIVRLSKKPDPVLFAVCLLCGTYKVFRTRNDYMIWAERIQSVLDTSKKKGINVDGKKKSMNNDGKNKLTNEYEKNQSTSQLEENKSISEQEDLDRKVKKLKI